MLLAPRLLVLNSKFFLPVSPIIFLTSSWEKSIYAFPKENTNNLIQLSSTLTSHVRPFIFGGYFYLNCMIQLVLIIINLTCILNLLNF